MNKNKRVYFLMIFCLIAFISCDKSEDILLDTTKNIESGKTDNTTLKRLIQSPGGGKGGDDFGDVINFVNVPILDIACCNEAADDMDYGVYLEKVNDKLRMTYFRNECYTGPLSATPFNNIHWTVTTNNNGLYSGGSASIEVVFDEDESYTVDMTMVTYATVSTIGTTIDASFCVSPQNIFATDFDSCSSLADLLLEPCPGPQNMADDTTSDGGDVGTTFSIVNP